MEKIPQGIGAVSPTSEGTAPISYRGTSLVRNRTPLGPYRRPMPRVLGGPGGVGAFLWARYPCMGNRMHDEYSSGRVLEPGRP